LASVTLGFDGSLMPSGYALQLGFSRL
jgi:hypothetical protein